MGDLSAALKFLGQDPVTQAIFEAETCAHMPLQLHLLDAVLAADARTVRKLLEEEDQNRVLADDFFLALSVILVGQADLPVLKAFQEHGYDAMTKPVQRGQGSDLRIGDIALRTCDVSHQRALVEAGFLDTPHWAYIGMGSSNPQQFDLWCDLHWQHAASRAPKDTAYPSPPQAGLEIFRWLPESDRREPTLSAASIRKEVARRLARMSEGFLALHYPEKPLASRWEAFLAAPPSVSTNARDASECVRYMKVFVDHQMHQIAPLRPTQLRVDVKITQGAHLAAALLQSGFTLADFDRDLVHLVLEECHQRLRTNTPPSEASNQLWQQVVRHLQKEDPARFASLPVELTGPFASLKTLGAFQTPEERIAFCEMLQMQLATPVSSASPPRPRL